MVEAYLDTLEIDLDNMKKIQSYLELVRRRSNGMQNLFYMIVADACIGCRNLIDSRNMDSKFRQITSRLSERLGCFSSNKL